MKLTLPVLFERPPKSDIFTVRPLLIRSASRSGKVLRRALDALGRDLKAALRNMSPQELLAAASFPPLSARRLELNVRVKKGVHVGRFLVVAFPAGELGRAAFFPTLEPGSPRLGAPAGKDLRHGLWFLVRRGQELESRAAEALGHCLRKNADLAPEDFEVKGWTDVMPLNLAVDLPNPLSLKKAKAERSGMILGGSDSFRGHEELDKTSLKLGGLYPSQLKRAFHRERALGEAADALWGQERRALLFLGPPGVGKTACIHELVFRRMEARDADGDGSGSEVYELAPRLVIAGMSYVGQWQKRLLVILKAVEKRDHVLVVTDLLDLFAVGRTRARDASLASVLKPFLERGRLRFLAEATPEVLRRVREQDRGFADLFKVVRLEPTDESGTLSIALKALRGQERDHDVRLRPEALAKVVELQRRFVRDQVFPGKAVAFIERLARRFARREDPVDAGDVVRLFADWSGLSRGFLDESLRLNRELVLEALSRRVVGQPEALGAIADTVLRARAGLNDTHKALASYLFIGPTGVGKTEAAKAAASYLYGSEERLLRIDMNEYPDALSVERLIGGPGDRGEGLLTRKLRLRPFSVVLFDEIEKAHPAVYDLLLQVLDEGHLTDAAGRVADFSNAIIILTSNLGVRRARGASGLPGGHEVARGIYREEVERFFRPEFVNRLDRMVPFDALGDSDLKTIARLVLDDVLRREGLRRRSVVLNLDDKVVERVVALGTDPELGARPLKRAVASLVMEPLGRQLAATTPEQATIAWVRGEGALSVELEVLEPAAAAALPASEALGRAEGRAAAGWLDARAAEILTAIRGKAGGRAIDLSRLEAGARLRYQLVEDLEGLREQLRGLIVSGEHAAPRRFYGSSASATQRRTTKARIIRKRFGMAMPQDRPDDDFADYVGQMARRDPSAGDRLLAYRRYLAALCRLIPAVDQERERRALLTFTSLAPLRGEVELAQLADLFAQVCLVLGHEARSPEGWAAFAAGVDDQYRFDALLIEGPAPEAVLAGELGVHLFLPRGRGPVPIQVELFACRTEDEGLARYGEALGALAGRRGDRRVLRSYRVVQSFGKDEEGLRAVSEGAPTDLSGGLRRSEPPAPKLRDQPLHMEAFDVRSGHSAYLRLPAELLLPFIELMFHGAALPDESGLPEAVGEPAERDEGEAQ